MATTPGKRKSKPKAASSPGAEEEPMSTDLSQYVTTKQAAEMMGVDDSSVRHLLIGGRLRGQKIGSEWLVYKPSIERYEQTKSAGGRPRSGKPKVEKVS
ncbi:MAG: helix-turn-helix domain-containing protein [Anaerolineae bacterium]